MMAAGSLLLSENEGNIHHQIFIEFCLEKVNKDGNLNINNISG